MAFRKKDKDAPPSSTRVYKFTIREPTENLELVNTQIRLGHDYRNQLVEIELARRDRFHEITATDPEAAAAVAAETAARERYDTACAALAELRKQSRRRDTPSDTKQALEELRCCEKATKAAKNKAARKPEIAERLAASEQIRTEAIKAARAASEAWWGTKGIMDRSVKTSGPPPNFKRWTGEGLVATQIQNGMSECEMLGGEDTQLRLELREDWGATRRASRYGKVWMRIGSNGRKPIWACFPIFYDRRIPENGRVKWVQVNKRKHGLKWHWYITFQVETMGDALEAKPLLKPAKLHNAIALDWGWRKFPDGSVRVCYGFDGTRSWEIRLPAWILERQDLIRNLRSIRDKHFDEVRARLVEWLASHTPPEEFREDLTWLPKWRSPARLARIAWRWKEAPAWLEEWRSRDRHLYQWERDLERALLNWREHWYRHWALWIATNYDHALLEDTDLSRMKRKPIPGEEGEGVVGAHMSAAAGELRAQICDTCTRDGTGVHLVPAAKTSRICAACGGEGLPKSDALMLQCSLCGVTCDRDCNAARVIHSFASGGTLVKTPGSLAVPEAPWYRKGFDIPKRIAARHERLEGVARESALERA